MKKVVFGITSLGLGGAERVLVDLVNKLIKQEEYQITVFTIYGKGELQKQLLPNINLESIYSKQYKELNIIQRKIIVPLKMLLCRKAIYKKYIQNKYDVEIAFLEGPITRIFSEGKQINKKIAWIHNDISKVFGQGIKANLKKKIDEKLYNKFSKLIFVSKNNLENFINAYPKNKAEKQIIYNYIDADEVKRKANLPIDEGEANTKTDLQICENECTNEPETEPSKQNTACINLLTVARLVPQKALDRLIKVHSKLVKEGLIHNLYLIGEGPEKEKLERLIKEQKCEDTVKMLGKKENPYPYMKNADYICLFSEFEGYGMVLEEAKILGKSILITDTAAKEALLNYPNSKIFENSEQGIYEGLKCILQTACKSEKIQEDQENQTAQNSFKTHEGQNMLSNNNVPSNEYDNTEIINQVEKIIEERTS